MKTFTTVVALASTVQLASATFGGASPFHCPANTNNECNPAQKPGFGWSGLNLGSFQNYGDFSFNGWSCASSFGKGGKRDIITGRTFQDKCITGHASHDTPSCPSFGVGPSKSVKDFSVTGFEFSTEFDCDLEFHYGMNDGSTCKHRSPCKAGGNIVKNDQCGGATSVTVVYPTQTYGQGTTKTGCSVGVHSMTFDCSSASTTKTYSTKSTTKTTPASTLATVTSSSTSAKITSTSSVAGTKSTYSASVPATTSSATLPGTTSSSVGETTTSSVVVDTTSSSVAGETSSSSVSVPVVSSSSFGYFNSTTSSVVVVDTTSSSVAGQTTTSSVVVDTTSSSVAGQTTTSSVVAETTPSASLTTSTIFTTSVSTIISCGPEVTNCPASSTVLTTVTVPISTTICPVGPPATTSSSGPVVSGASSSGPVVSGTTAVSSVSATSPAGPVETAPCPAVLPSCLNTWLFSEGCASNTDSDCYCSSADFVTKVFECVSAHAASDDEVAAAQNYFQGICAPYIPSNPAIVTGATSVTVTAPATSSVPSTTIQITQIYTVPVYETTGLSFGAVIPSTSTTTLVSTVLTVPQVIFQTYPAAPVGPGEAPSTATATAALVAGTPAAVVAQPTYAAVPTSVAPVGGNSTITPGTVPFQTTGAGVQNTVAFGAVSFALFFAILAL